MLFLHVETNANVVFHISTLHICNTFLRFFIAKLRVSSFGVVHLLLTICHAMAFRWLHSLSLSSFPVDTLKLCFAFDINCENATFAWHILSSQTNNKE